jgi:methyl-accepting chemotaxis protein
MPALAIPDLSSIAGSRDGILGGIEQLAQALPADPSSLVAGLSADDLQGALGSLDLGAVTGALQSLQSALPDGSLAVIEQLLTALSGALGGLAPLKDQLTHEGSLLDLKSFALQQVGDPTAHIADLLGNLTSTISPEAIQTLETFVQTVTAFESSIPTDTGQVAEFLARGFLGVPHDLLAPARAALDGFGGQIGSLAPQPALDALAAAATALAGELGTTRTLVLALDPADAPGYTAAIAAMTQLRNHVRDFAAQVGALVNGFQTGLGALDPGGFLSAVESALAAVPEIHAADTGAFAEIVTDPIRRLNAAIDTLTPEQVAAALGRGSAFAEHELIGEGFDELSAMLRKPFEEIAHLIEGLHLEAIREAFRSALAPVHDGIATVTGALSSVRGEVVQAVTAAGAAVDALTSAAGEVEGALDDLANEVTSAASSVDLQAFHDEAVNLIDEVAQAIDGLVEDADEALQELRGLIGQLGDIDLSVAASAATDLIGRITDTLSGIDTSSVPDALLSELKSALQGLLGQISLQPVHDAIDQALQAGPVELLDEFTKAVDDVLKQVEDFSPAGLLEPLQAPFDEIVRSLNDLHPGHLLDPVVSALNDAKTALDGFSPATLLAPLDAPLNEAKQAVMQLAPEQLLQPLHQPFADLMALVDKLDGKAAVDALEDELGGLFEQGIGGLQGLGDAFSGAGGTKSFVDDAAAGALPEGFGLRPGDVLLPVSELYQKLVGLLDQVPIATLVAAFEQLRETLVGTLDALDPANLRAHVHGLVEQALEPLAVPDTIFAGHLQLVLAVDAIDPAKAAGDHAQLLSLTLEADPRAALAPAFDQLHALRGDALSLAGSLEVGTLGSFGVVQQRLEALIPDFLRRPVTAESLHAALDALDPKHIADEVNQEFDLLLEKLLKFAGVLAEELPKVVGDWTGKIQHGLDGLIRDAFDAVHAPLKAQLENLDPAKLEADLDHEVFEPIRTALDSLSLESILNDAGLTAKYDQAKTALAGVIDSLQNLKSSLDSAFDTAVDGLLAISPRSLEPDLQQAYAPIAQSLAGLSLDGIADDLKAQFQRIGDQAADVLQAVLEALQAMVAAIPSGVEGASGDRSFGLGA